MENQGKSFVNDDLVELGPNGEWPAFYHADDCGNYCDYACGGTWCENEAMIETVAKSRHERKVNAVFIVRRPMRAADGSDWRLSPGQKSIGVKEDAVESVWWVEFPGGIWFDYHDVDNDDELFTRLQ